MAVALALRCARGRSAQQAAIDEWLQRRPAVDSASGAAIVAEGAFFELAVPPDVPIARLAPGCVCCVGELPLRVTLARVLRAYRPQSVLLLLSDTAHLGRVLSRLDGGQLGVTLEIEP